MIDFKLPSLGADMDEGTLLEWKVKPGDAVKRGDIVAVVDTTKAAIDVESWVEGTVHELIVQPGETVPVGAVLATFSAQGEEPEAAKAPPAPEKPETKKAGTKTAGAITAEAKPAPAAAPAAPPPAPAGRAKVSPAARKRAEELGVKPESLTGTGPQGSITLEDVERAAKAAPAAAPEKSRAAEMRKTIAAAMARAKREIPHYYLGETVPLAAATAWLAEYNAGRAVTERVLMAALLLKAVASAAKQFPEVNGFYRDGTFTPAPAVHAGVAISLRGGGLIAPAIHDVDSRPVSEIMPALADLVQRARAGSLRSSEIADPTITVTNLGEQGVEDVYGVIYPPQVALVGFGRVAEQVIAENGAIRVVPAVRASLSADHRVSDGHRGALFLAKIRALLQEPANLAKAEP
jgi:pyruvate dehydrogenase E2 component (dihydrolipoamide acetyltransferase)